MYEAMTGRFLLDFEREFQSELSFLSPGCRLQLNQLRVQYKRGYNEQAGGGVAYSFSDVIVELTY